MATTRSDFRLIRWLYTDDSPAAAAQVDGTLSWRVTAPLRRVRAFQMQAFVHFRGRNPDLLPDDPETFPHLDGLNRLTALRQRLTSAAETLAPGRLRPDDGTTTDLLIGLADIVRESRSLSSAWLFCVAVTGVFPQSDEVQSVSRILARSDDDVVPAVLELLAPTIHSRGSYYRTLDVVVGAVVVDVDFCARFGFMSGIQRVVRNLVQQWEGDHEALLVAWTHDGSALRHLTPVERGLVVDWKPSDRHVQPVEPHDGFARVVVPWNATVFLPEVATTRFVSALAGLVEHGGSKTVALGYDAIPMTNGAYVSIPESLTFARYLTVVKHADLVIPISEAAGEEFSGFAAALPAQGLRGPAVQVVPLATAAVAHDRPSVVEPSGVPVVLCVGSHEIRKNQIVVAYAAEMLWRRGHRFTLLIIGGSGPAWYHELDDKVAELAISGYPASMLRAVTDGELAAAYSNARFSVFTSVHEGFGLPIVESLAASTPVITTRYGSMAEIAALGGCLTVDPTDVAETAAAMESLLVDDVELNRLKAEIQKRPTRTWADYAEEIWALVGADTETRTP